MKHLKGTVCPKIEHSETAHHIIFERRQTSLQLSPKLSNLHHNDLWVNIFHSRLAFAKSCNKL